MYDRLNSSLPKYSTLLEESAPSSTLISSPEILCAAGGQCSLLYLKLSIDGSKLSWFRKDQSNILSIYGRPQFERSWPRDQLVLNRILKSLCSISTCSQLAAALSSVFWQWRSHTVIPQQHSGKDYCIHLKCRDGQNKRKNNPSMGQFNSPLLK